FSGPRPGPLPAAGYPHRRPTQGRQRRRPVVVTAAVVVVLPHGGDVLVVQVGAPVRLGQHVRAVHVTASTGQEPTAHHHVELARQLPVELHRGTVDRPGHPVQGARVDVRGRG